MGALLSPFSRKRLEQLGQLDAVRLASGKNGFSDARRQQRYAPCGRHLVVLAQHSDQVLNAILSMADRQDLLLARKVEDLRRSVLELAALMGEPDPL